LHREREADRAVEVTMASGYARRDAGNDAHPEPREHAMSNGIARCAIAAVLFGISAPAASRLAGNMNPFTLAGLLYVGAALTVAPFLGRVRPSRETVRRSGRRLATAVVFGGAIAPVLLASGLRHTPAATASLMLNLELVFTTILAVLVFGEHLGRSVVTGTLLVVMAGVVVAWSNNPSLRWGAVLVAGACLCWGIDNCVTANLDELAPAHITLVKGVVAGGVNLVVGLAVSGAPTGWRTLGALLVGGFGYGLSITLWVSGARELGAARGQLVFATAPFVGAVVAWTVFSEPIGTRQVVSLLIAVTGVSFVLRSDHLHQHDHSPVEHDHDHGHADGHHNHDHASPVTRRHQHRHAHEMVAHAHPHMPDIHHRHDHAGS
jgi:drug/metabolite transporter (DMT)-like permease